MESSIHTCALIEEHATDFNHEIDCLSKAPAEPVRRSARRVVSTTVLDKYCSTMLDKVLQSTVFHPGGTAGILHRHDRAREQLGDARREEQQRGHMGSDA
jgi:hypothetical protein